MYSVYLKNIYKLGSYIILFVTNNLQEQVQIIQHL